MESQHNDVMILAIESSCDETAAAVVKNGREICSNVINSQIKLHQRYGGVVPELASRSHIEAIDGVIDEALKDASIGFHEVDAIAVTNGPGLVGALLVGVSTAKALAFALGKPLVGVHHIRAHIMANFLAHPDLKPPFVCLVASGGHSHIVLVESETNFHVIGRTCDDAAGEAYDKVARVLGLGYPGGPIIDGLAKQGNPHAVEFPRVKMENEFDFSFSGVKTAVINHIHKMDQTKTLYEKADIAASFQAAVVDVLCDHTIAAARHTRMSQVALAGGVASNSALRAAFEKACNERNYKFFVPPAILCTDNAAMVGCAGYYEYMSGKRSDLTLNAIANLDISEG